MGCPATTVHPGPGPRPLRRRPAKLCMLNNEWILFYSRPLSSTPKISTSQHHKHNHSKRVVSRQSSPFPFLLYLRPTQPKFRGARGGGGLNAEFGRPNFAFSLAFVLFCYPPPYTHFVLLPARSDDERSTDDDDVENQPRTHTPRQKKEARPPARLIYSTNKNV